MYLFLVKQLLLKFLPIIFVYGFFAATSWSMALASLFLELLLISLPFYYKENIALIPKFYWLALTLIILGVVSSAIYNHSTDYNAFSNSAKALRDLWRIIIPLLVGGVLLKVNLKKLLIISWVLLTLHAWLGISQYFGLFFDDLICYSCPDILPKIGSINYFNYQTDSYIYFISERFSYSCLDGTIRFLAEGLANHHLFFAQLMLALFFPLLAISLLKNIKLSYRLLIIFALAACFLALIYSFSRTAWLAMIAGAGLLLFLRLGYRLLKPIPIAIFIGLSGIFGLLLYLFAPRQIDRIKSIFSIASNIDRIYMWQAALNVLKNSWLFGQGRYNIAAITAQYDQIEQAIGYRFINPPAVGVHNIYLQSWLDYGLLGMIGVVILIVGTALFAIINYLKWQNKIAAIDASLITEHLPPGLNLEQLMSIMLGLAVFVSIMPFFGIFEHWLNTGISKNIIFGYYGLIYALIYQLNKNALLIDKKIERLKKNHDK